MALIYPDSEPKRGGGFNIPYSALNATTGYMNHFNNYMYLDFLAKNSKDALEKAQARKEIVICQRKMDFWKKHPNFSSRTVELMMAEVKKQWKVL